MMKKKVHLARQMGQMNQTAENHKLKKKSQKLFLHDSKLKELKLRSLFVKWKKANLYYFNDFNCFRINICTY